jgi:hypothetical protein
MITVVCYSGINILANIIVTFFKIAFFFFDVTFSFVSGLVKYQNVGYLQSHVTKAIACMVLSLIQKALYTCSHRVYLYAQVTASYLLHVYLKNFAIIIILHYFSLFCLFAK